MPFGRGSALNISLKKFESDIDNSKVIAEELAPLVGRGSYKRLCQFLRQMKKLGAEVRVKTLVEKLCVQYKNRPAMLEELQEV